MGRTRSSDEIYIARTNSTFLPRQKTVQEVVKTQEPLAVFPPKAEDGPSVRSILVYRGVDTLAGEPTLCIVREFDTAVLAQPLFNGLTAKAPPSECIRDCGSDVEYVCHDVPATEGVPVLRDIAQGVPVGFSPLYSPIPEAK